MYFAFTVFNQLTKQLLSNFKRLKSLKYNQPSGLRLLIKKNSVPRLKNTQKRY